MLRITCLEQMDSAVPIDGDQTNYGEAMGMVTNSLFTVTK